jgi:hypothetical protein
MKDYETPVSHCPECNEKIDHAVNMATELKSKILANGKPREGTVSICFNCTEILQFDADLHLHKLKDFDGMPSEFIMEVLRLRRAVIYVRQKHEKTKG